MSGFAIMQHLGRPPYAGASCIRLFATRGQAERCRNGFGEIVEVCVEEHYRGPLPRGGAKFTKEDQSYHQMMAQIMAADLGE